MPSGNTIRGGCELLGPEKSLIRCSFRPWMFSANKLAYLRTSLAMKGKAS